MMITSPLPHAMRRLFLAAAAVSVLACDSSTGNDDFTLSQADVEAAPVTATVSQGQALELRLTNHTDRELKAALLVQDIDIWPDDRLWGTFNGALYKIDGITLAPGETVTETVDFVETLGAGPHQYNVGISAWNGNTPIAGMWKAVNFTVDP